MNVEVARQVAEYLLEIKAVILRPNQPFTWSMGWKSPIYCDNRITLGQVKVRNYLIESWAKILNSEYPMADSMAGVATAGISHAALLADRLQLPMAYVRSKPKEHGTGKMTEGQLPNQAKCIIIEDLISTAGSSINALQALRAENTNPLCISAIFNYGFQQATIALADNNIEALWLCDYSSLIEVAKEKNFVSENDLTALQEWRLSPSTWKQ